MWVNTWVHAITGKHQRASLGMAMASVLAVKEKGQLNGSCSTSNCKNILEFSVTYWYLPASWRWAEQAPATFCSVKAEETTWVRLLSQPGFPLKPAQASAFVKHLRRADKDTDSFIARYILGNWVPYRAFTRDKVTQQFSQRSVIKSLTASFSRGDRIILGVEDVILLATGYQFQLYKPLHGKTSGNNYIVLFQKTVYIKRRGRGMLVKGMLQLKANQSILLSSCIVRGDNALFIKDKEKDLWRRYGSHCQSKETQNFYRNWQATLIGSVLKNCLHKSIW